ncbi:hypothetical protein LAV82_23470 [Bacillus sp. ILBB4]|nr:hypothetical protein [Bacillus sp. ILBB4]
MIIKEDVKKIIHVIHNSKTEMIEAIETLKEEEWSDNTRVSVVGIPLFKKTIDNVEDFQKKHPDVTIHEDRPGYLSMGKFVYYTTHERSFFE